MAKSKKSKNLKNAKLHKKAKKKYKKELTLKIAVKKDFLSFLGRVKKKNKYEPKYGVPYFLINSKGEVENNNYIFTEETNIEEFNNYLLHEQILIIKNTL